MKLNKWLYGAAALAMLAACSDRDVQNSDGPSKETGDGYIGINIKLPASVSTRAEFDPEKTGNDNFDDGVASEYAVNDAILVLFQGGSEKEATFSGAFNLQNSSEYQDQEEDNNQVTVHITRVANVSGIDDTKKLYALVMVNGAGSNNIYTTENPEQDWMRNKTIADFQEYAIENSLFNQTTPGSTFASKIFMTNSPLSLIEGGGKDPGIIQEALPVLVELNPKTYETATEALSHPAATINVERAVGKITCSNFGKNTGEEDQPLTIKCGDYEYTLTVSSVAWDMAQNMSNTFIVRNTNRSKPGLSEKLWKWNYANTESDATSGPYRMIGSAQLNSKNKDNAFETYYRPYFCRVPGYGELMAGSTVKENKTFENSAITGEGVALTGTSATGGFASTGAFYPRENTFPVENMKYANTTRVGFWVNFSFTPVTSGAPAISNGVNFYIKGADKSIIYLDNEKGLNPLEANAVEVLKNNNALQTALNNALLANHSLTGFDLGKALVFEYDDVKSISGLLKIKSISFNTNLHDPVYQEAFASVPAFTFTDDLIANINNYGQFYEYKGGKVFYETRIKHFGDDQTPWSSGAEGATTIDQAYGPGNSADAIELRNNKYLGRYGIVRNNWYDLNVKAITKLGDPRDPALWDASNWEGKPDDNKDEYISVELHVLSWAKRVQEVIF